MLNNLYAASRRLAGRQAALFSIALVLSIAVAACDSRQTESKGDRYELKGEVVAVDTPASALVISHEDIPDFMDAMTMPFTLKDPYWLGVARPGDKVTATLVVDNDRSWLEDVVIVSEGAENPDAEAGGSAPGEPESKPGDPVPNFTLVNQDGKNISLDQYRGRALVLTFIYTRCPLPDYCPLMTSNFTQIDRELEKDAGLGAKTHLLSVSVDPAFDTPKVLRAYGEGHGLKEFKRWEYASGSEGEVRKMAEYFGLQYKEEGGQIVHSLRTAIIDPEGKLVKIYRANEWKPSEVLADLRSLNQPAPHS